MGSAVPMPNSDTQQFLENARSQAVQGLKGNFPQGMLDQLQAPLGPKAAPAIPNPQTAAAAPPAEEPPPPLPGPNSTPVVNYEGGHAPTPEAPPAPETPGFLADEFKGTGRVVFNHVMASFAALGGSLGRTGTGMAMAEDPAHAEDAVKAGHDYIDKVTDDAQARWLKDANDQAAGGGAQMLGDVAGMLPSLLLPVGVVTMPLSAADQKYHELTQQGINPATSAKEALATAFAMAAGLKISHAFPGLVPWVRASIQHIATGVVGNTAVQAAQNALSKYILSTDGYKDAAAQIDPTDPSTIEQSGIMGMIYGAINAFTHGGAKPPKNPPPDPNVGAPLLPGPDSQPITAGTGEPPPPPGPGPNSQPVTFAGRGVTSEGAPVTPVDVNNAALNAATKPAPPAAPEPDMIPGPGGKMIPNPNAGIKAQTPAPGMSGGWKARFAGQGDNLEATIPPELQKPGPNAKPVVSAPLPEAPSQEPLTDLKAQVAAVKDPAQSRTHVYLPADTVTALGPDGVKALADGLPTTKNFDKNGGVLISQNFSERSKAAALRSKNGADMQATLGALTGAGEGKSPDQTAVVQGQTPEGAVVKESMVKPEDVPAAVVAAGAEGHTPVVTTPEAAVQRRAEMVQAETPAAPTEKAPIAAAPEGGTEAQPTAKAETPPAPEPKEGTIVPKKGDRRIVKINGEDVPVVIAGETAGNKTPVHIVDDDGRVSKAVQYVPAELFKEEKPPTPAAAEVRAASASEAPAKGEAVASATAEPAAAPAPLEAAVKFFDQANTPPVGKKFAGSVSEHAGRVGRLARALKDNLKNFPDAAPEVMEHAIAAANAVARVDMKTEESMMHNRGVGHSMLDQRAADIKQAIHNLTHPDDVTIPPPVQVKAEAFKKSLAKAREKAAAEKAAAEKAAAEKAKPVETAPAEQPEPVKKVASGIKDVPDVTKPKTLNAGEKARIGAAIGRYMRVDPDDAAGAHDNLQRVLHEVYGPERFNESEDILNLAREQRADEREAHDTARRGGGRMSDTVDENEFRGRHEDVEDEAEPEEARVNVKISPTSPLGRLHTALAGTGLFERLEAARDAGTFVGTHDVLDHMIDVAHKSGNWVMEQALSKLRARAPDEPIRPVDRVVTPRTGKLFPLSTVGLHDPATHTIQVRMGPAETTPVSVTHSLAHEPGHGAVTYEMQHNPDGKFAQTFKVIHAEAVRRAQAMGIDPKSHYGLHTPGELAAELPINQELRDFLAKSESVAPKGAAPSLLARAWDAIREFFGAKDPRVNAAIKTLLQRADTALEQGREAQWRTRADLRNASAPDFLKTHPDRIERLQAQGRLPEFDPTDHMPGLDDALKIEALKDPPPLQHEDRFRKAAGDVATATARQFRTVMRSGLIESIRRTTRALTPYDALIRTQLRRGTFGHDEPGNPLRDYNESIQQRNAAMNRLSGRAEPVVALRAKLSSADDEKLGRFQDDIGSHGFKIEEPAADQAKSVRADKKFPQKWQEMQDRWAKLTPEQQDVYRQERDYNEWSARENRKASVNLAIDSFTDKEVSKAQRALLYSAKDRGDFDSMIGPGKEIDVGERNTDLREALKDISSSGEIEGDYFHKGRSGEYVVQVRPEVDKSFDTQREAEAHAAAISELSNGSKAKVEQVGGKWQVTGKAEYVSMHEKIADAEKEVARLQAAGHDVGSATQKILSAQNADLSKGFQSIYSEASRRLDRRLGVSEKQDKAIEDVKASLRNAFVSQMAARSAYAGSKLARRNVGGVKADEMGRNFATHAQSQAWNTGHMATVLQTGDALSRLKNAVKDDTQTQSSALQRGRVYDEIQRRLRQEVAQYGSHQPFNGAMAKLGFMNYMTSASHAMLYLTQNFTTAIPVAMSRFGAGRSMSAFGSAMRMVSGPAFSETYRALTLQHGHDVDSIQHAILGAVAKDARFGKWAKGGDSSPLQQLIDRGIIHTSLSNQLALAAHGGNQFTNKVMEYARITAAMADMFNRVSTGVAALELHKGDVYKAGDFVKETHIDYSQENKSRAFKAVGKLWGGNSVTMFRSYITGMTHLLYSHIYDAAAGTDNGSALGGRGTALKTVAGLMLGTMLFAGVQRSLGIEPVRLAMYAYHKLVGDNNEYYSFDNSARRAIKSFAGDGKLAEVLNGGLPRLLGVDMSSRMGLSDLFFHNPPDVLSLNADSIMKMLGSLTGPMGELAAQEIGNFNKAAETGRLDDWMRMVPIKAVQNVFDAYKAGTSGKITPSGAQITQPSAGAALVHGTGFRTGQEAELSAKAQTESDYKQWASDRKYMFLKEWTSAPVADRAKVQEKINAFNLANPGHRITASDKLKAQRGVYRTQQEAAGLPGRDAVVNELRSH